MGERSYTFTPEKGESLEAFVQRSWRTLERDERTPLLFMAFGLNAAFPGFLKALLACAGEQEWPIQWVEGMPCGDHCMAGLQVFTLGKTDGSIRRVRQRGKVLASTWVEGGVRHLLTGGIAPQSTESGLLEQTEEVFHSLEMILESARFSLSDLARTWFYNREILSWYDLFNEVRNRVYGANSFRIGSLPASTAVAGSHPQGGALQLAAWAMAPVERIWEPVCELASPLQCPAPAYGSAFSRAIECVARDGRNLVLVSGTASIEPGGKTVNLNDPKAQIELSLDVVVALLAARGLSFKNCTRAIVYFKKAESLPLFRDSLVSRGLTHFSYLPVHCDICRDDLLFEIELDARA